MKTRSLKASMRAAASGSVLALALCAGAFAPAHAQELDVKGALVYNLQPVIFPYMAAQTEGVEQAAKKYNVKLVNANANGSLETQISQVKAAIAAGAKGIVIQTNDSIGIIPVIQEAVDAGVCVAAAAVAIGPDTGKVYPGTKGLVAWDETYSAKVLAEAMAQAIDGEGDVALQVGLLTNGTSKARLDSIKAHWAENYPKINIVSVEQHQASSASSMALRTSPPTYMKRCFSASTWFAMSLSSTG